MPQLSIGGKDYYDGLNEEILAVLNSKPNILYIGALITLHFTQLIYLGQQDYEVEQ